MARQIDERVVEMRFDNSDFMKKVKPTISSLEKLKESLKLQDAAKGFDVMQQAANKVDMKGLGKTIDDVKTKFSALEAIAVGALFRIGEQAITAGERLLKSLTVEPISQGFAEYELKMNSVQTIMASTGESLDTVNQYLEELNHYADKTIYSFSDMTQNIGKFTNAGVKLEDAVKAIQGVSNEAAVSGANANEASRAMYNFAQALSAGYVKLIDWKSIENANMATVEFKDQLLQTALAMGTVVKEGDNYRSVTTDLNGKVSDLFNKTMNFNDSLSHQWLTTDVLVQALSNYSTDVREMSESEKKAYEEKLKTIGYTEEQIQQIEELGKKAFDSAQDVKTFHQLLDTLREAVGSGWAQTFELIFGDFEEAKKLWTSINKVVGGFLDNQSKARNDLLKGWKDLGGRDNILEGLTNAGKALSKVFGAIGDAFREVFPPTHVSTLLKISSGFKKLTASLIISDDAASLLKTVFKGLFTVIKGGLSIIGKITGGIVKLGNMGFNALSPLIQEFEKFLIQLRDSGKAQKYLEDVVNWFVKLGEICAPYVEYVINEVQAFATELENLISPEITKFLNNLEKAWDDLLETIGDVDFSTPIKAFESLKKIWEGLLKFLTGNDRLNRYIENMVTYLGRLKDAFTFDHAIDNIQSFEDKFNKFSDWISKKIEPLKVLLSGISVGDVAAIGTGAGIIYFITKIAKAFGEGAEKLKALPEVFESIGGALKAYQDKLKAERLKEIAKAILILSAALVILSFADMDKVFGAAIALSVIAGALSLGMSKLGGAFSKAKTIDDAVYTFSKSVNNLAKAVKWKAIGSALKSFGESILMIAGAIAILALMYERNPEAMQNATKLVAEIAAAIVGMIVVLEFVSERMNKGARNIASMGIGIFAISSALYIAVKAIDKIFNLQIPVDYKDKLTILAGVFLGLVLVAKAVSKSNGTVAKGGSNKEILALAVLLYASVLALNKLFKMELPLDYKDKLAIMAGIFLGLGYVAKSIGKASRNTNGALKAGGTILAMAIFMGATVASLHFLTEMDSDKLTKAAIVFGGLLLTLSQAIKNAAKNAESSKGSYKTILSMALMVGVVTLALGALALIPLEKLAKSVVALGVVLGILSSAFKNVSDIKSNKGALDVIITMVIAIVAIAGSLYVLAKMPWNSLLAAGVAIGLVLESFTKAASTLSAKKGLHPEKIIQYLALFAALVPIGWYLSRLASFPWDGLLAAAASMSLVILAMAEVMNIISSVGKLDLKTIGSFYAMLVPLAGITVTLMVLADKPWDGLLAAAASMSLVLATMTGVLAVLTLLGAKSSGALVGVLGLTVLLLPMLGVMLMLKDLAAMNPESLIAAAEAISMVMGAMVVALGACTVAGLAAPAAFVGLGALVTVVEVLKGLMVKLGELFQDPNVEAFLDKGAEIMAKIGAAIGDFIGNLVGGAISSAMMQIAADLPKLATYLSDFAIRLQPFIVGIKQVNQDCISAVKSLVSLILLLTAADLLDGISDFFSFFTGNKSLSKFASQLSEFMPFFKDFANQTDGIDGQNVKNCAEAMVYLFKSFGEIPNEGGWISKLTGDNALTKEYAESVGAMGEALKKFYDQTASVNKIKVNNAADAMVVLFKAFSEMPNSGGILGDIVGNNDISEYYADQMVAMAIGLKNYSDNVLTINKDKVIDSATAMQAVFQAFSEMPNTGGILGDIVGNNDISELYADQMVAMAIGLKNYSDNVLTVNKDKVVESAGALRSLFQAFSEIPNEGGIISWFTGDNDIATFGANLKAFGESFAAYYDAIDEIEFSTLSQAAAQVRSLIGISNSLAGMDDMYVIEDFAASLASISGDCLNGFIAAFGDENVEKAATAFTKLLVAIAAVIEERYETFYNYGIQIVTYWLDGMASTYESVIEAANLFIAQFMLVFDIMLVVFYLKGFSSATQFLSGFKFKYPEAFSTGRQLADQALSGIEAVIPEFYSAGERAGQGFVIGLESQKGAVEAAAAGLAAAAAAASASALDINSPSKVFKRQGGYAGEGFVLGMVSWTNRVAEAAARLGNVAAEQTASSVSSISQVLTDGISTDVVITPTFDLSGVKSSADEVNQMFNQSVRSLAVTAGVVSSSVDAATETKERTNIQNQPGDLKAGNNFTFIQNNTSPKALSRIDIYRQTRNQFSNFRREVGKG